MLDLSDDFKKIDVLVLCGGEGKRLRPVVSDRPKVMASVGERPFLEIVLENLAQAGFQKFILGVGHLRDQIINHFSRNKYFGGNSLDIKFSEEEFPLGTGGAVKNAKNFIKSDNFLVLNGDILFKFPFKKFYEAHLNFDPLISIMLSRVSDIRDYGSVRIDDNSRILSFLEKNSQEGEGLVSAGVYFMKRDIFSHMPDADSFSLEYDVFPNILNHKCHGFVTDEQFVDIGTPERYQKILEIFSHNS